MAGIKKDKPSAEWWDEARKYVNSCSSEELRLFRIIAANEIEKRLSQWGQKVDESLAKSKAVKSRAIKRKIIKKADV